MTVIATGCTADAGQPTAAAQTPVAASIAPAPTWSPAARLVPVPKPGTVTIEPGPFTDRLSLTKLRLKAGSRPAVMATVENVADVSELIVLEFRADFYDARGHLIGAGTAAYADEEFADNGATPVPHGTGTHGESIPVVITSSRGIAGASSAVITVPQLVNE